MAQFKKTIDRGGLIMSILILTPALNKEGGISNYFNALKDKFCLKIDYFIRGSRKHSENIIKSIVRIFYDYLKYLQILKNYDLIHINSSLGKSSTPRDAFFLAIAIILRKKTIVFFRGWDKKYEYKIEKYYLQIFKSIFFKSDLIIVLASEFKNVLIKWGYKKNIYLETTLVDDSLVINTEQAIKNKKVSLTNPNLSLLFLARIEKEKGVYETIDAFKILKSKYPLLSLKIAGTGKESSNLKRYIYKEYIKGIEFVGYVKSNEKREVFLNSDIYILPSFYGEGMPNSLLEAMAFGLPVITRPVGGIKDFFEDGKMGFLTESRDPKIISNLIDKLIANQTLMYKIGKYNYHYAQKYFLASKVVIRLEKIYSELLKNV